MVNNNVIEIEDATVCFNMSAEKVDNIKEYFIKLVKRQLHFVEFQALKNINFKVEKGESWGIIGRNGAGKSTLLRLICNIINPTIGSVAVNGRISPILELGAGFDGNMTARENVYMEGALLGYSKDFMKEKFDEIIEFSELEKFIDMPVKNFSSGMRARLAFSIATIVEPEILIVDEVLAVGDAAFQKKCEVRMNQILSNSATVLFVSHNEGQIKNLCKKVLWLREGEAVMAGDVNEVCAAYKEYYK